MPPPCCGCVRARVPGRNRVSCSFLISNAYTTARYVMVQPTSARVLSRAQRNCNTHGRTSPLATDAVVMALMLFALSHFHIHVMSMRIMLPCHVTNKGQLSCDPCALTTTSRPPPLAVFRSVVTWCHHPFLQARKVLQRRALV